MLEVWTHRTTSAGSCDAAMLTMRGISVLPSIKCSSCGAEIEISMMGDHICTGHAKAPPQQQYSASPPLPFAAAPRSASPRLGVNTSPDLGHASDKNQFKSSRIRPPRIDPSAANRPFVQRASPAPSSHVSSNGRSPASISAGNQPSRPPTSRSATNPLPRFVRPPSPELSSNLDCAFPPWPGSTTPASPASRASPKSSAVSVVSETGSSVAPGRDGIWAGSLKPDGNALGLTGESRQYDASYHRTKTRFGDAQTVQPPRRPSADERQASVPRPPAWSHTSERPMSPPHISSRKRAPPARPMRPGGVDGFLVKLREETTSDNVASSRLHADKRSNTFPVQQQVNSVDRRPSEPAPRSGRPTLAQPERSMFNATSARPSAPLRSETMPSALPFGFSVTPRSASRTGCRADPRMREESANQRHPSSQTDHLAHAPSNSGSSTHSSGSSAGSSAKTSASPPLSAASSVSAASSRADRDRDYKDASLGPAPLQPRGKLGLARGQDQTPATNADTSQHSRPWAPPTLPSQQWVPPSRPYAPLMQSSTSIPEYVTPPKQRFQTPPESPMDPAVQKGVLRINPRGFTPTPPADSSPQEYFPPRPLPTRSQSERQLPIQNDPLPAEMPRDARRPGTVAKHVCRGCQEPIVGKSVKAADGRLTGRYHKQCFVCKTCKSPFTTADFYVIDNDPYCEHHYHQLNNSLCAGCDGGIEGQYLETQAQQKFHPCCFTCLTCRTVLRDDYFEISGKVYCERHAFAAIRSQGGLGPKRNMERRTTRLMVM